MSIKDETRTARIASSVAATIIALACGTNYGYSAWGPQFADKLHLSATESEVIGLSGNLGMYLMGVPVGMFTDSRGPRPAVLGGAVLLGLGYLPLQRAYDAGQGSVLWLSFASFLTGLGGCAAFAAVVKASALNWPHHRGTATAFPIAAFGLSAFFFSLVSSIFFPGNPGQFLLLLSIGTTTMILTGFFFLRVLPPPTTYRSVPASDTEIDDSGELHVAVSSSEPGMLPSYATITATASKHSHHYPSNPEEPADGRDPDIGSSRSVAVRDAAHPSRSTPDEINEVDESCSLLPPPAATLLLPDEVSVQSSIDLDHSHRLDIRGWTLLKTPEFWRLLTIMGLLSGIGLMTINNIGNDATALWKHYDDSINDKTLALYQQVHVSILSLGSFAGRLLSGVGSDFLVKVMHASRMWCLVVASVIFALAQICALSIVNPHLLGFVSGFNGLGYGFLFGVFPSITAESFGVHGLTQNWGFMTLAPVVTGNIFNLFYGLILDAHSVVEPDGKRRCEEGIHCYRPAYVVALLSCVLGLVVTLWVIWHQARTRLREIGKGHMRE
ncbi:MFS general substrate transporter [Xylaria sp. CBS 124048]|nr:MFS general substrate transporter [Xylaria sp. CBS 124048]